MIKAPKKENFLYKNTFFKKIHEAIGHVVAKGYYPKHLSYYVLG